ncbi:hypothetical protein CROQUDRAFT_99612 [Cronartium quercuum f. sp. fusiforme G11]|uniref:Proteophosphoglycan ppg4 n=1 Tax=Cronartium quercuum f. sp. fusiforme G11 TaxID=708437 RepID=A0A9P6NAL8_9BASI|nr:hypothetical protein CROQUDRAFT_99612 [Cronartium quercuum f. sp. fusiforme G11]
MSFSPSSSPSPSPSPSPSSSSSSSISSLLDQSHSPAFSRLSFLPPPLPPPLPTCPLPSIPCSPITPNTSTSTSSKKFPSSLNLSTPHSPISRQPHSAPPHQSSLPKPSPPISRLTHNQPIRSHTLSASSDLDSLPHPPLPPTGRATSTLPYSNHPSNNHGSVSYQKPRSTSSPIKPSRYLLTVIPPESLPHDPPHPRTSPACSGYGPAHAFRRGTLIPLYPTLSSQLGAIAREYGLPSTGGMLLYLIEGSARLGEIGSQMAGGPRIGEDAWQMLWAGIFEEEEAAAAAEELLAREKLEAERESLQFHSFPAPHHTRSSLVHEEDEQEEILNGAHFATSSVRLPQDSGEEESDPGTDIDPLCMPTRRGSRSVASTGRSSRATKALRHQASEASLAPSLNSRLPQRTFTGQQAHSSAMRYHRSDSTRHPSVASTSSSPFSLSHPRSDSLVSYSIPSTGSRHHTRRPSSSLASARSSAALRLPRASLVDDRASLFSSLSALTQSTSTSRYDRSKPVGLGVIVGKIEFEIDRRRAPGKWYEHWLEAAAGPLELPLSACPMLAESPVRGRGTGGELGEPLPLMLPSMLGAASSTNLIKEETPTPSTPPVPRHDREATIKSGPPPSLPLPLPPSGSASVIPHSGSSEGSNGDETAPAGYATLADSVSSSEGGHVDFDRDPLAGIFPSDHQTWAQSTHVRTDSAGPELNYGAGLETEVEEPVVEEAKEEVKEVMQMLQLVPHSPVLPTTLSSPIRLDVSAPNTTDGISPSTINTLEPPSDTHLSPHPRARHSTTQMQAELDDLERSLAELSPRALKSPHRNGPSSTESALELMMSKKSRSETLSPLPNIPGPSSIEEPNPIGVNELIEPNNPIGVNDHIEPNNPIGVNEPIEPNNPIRVNDHIEPNNPIGVSDHIEPNNPIGEPTPIRRMKKTSMMFGGKGGATSPVNKLFSPSSWNIGGSNNNNNNNNRKLKSYENVIDDILGETTIKQRPTSNTSLWGRRRRKIAEEEAATVSANRNRGRVTAGEGSGTGRRIRSSTKKGG